MSKLLLGIYVNARSQFAEVIVQGPYYVPVQQPIVSVPAPQPPAPQLTCDWSEHTSPEGYKYYYNSTSGESKVCH